MLAKNYFIVNTDNPGLATSSWANKKLVRSIAAHESWPARRQKIAENSGSSTRGQGIFLVDLDQPNEQQTSSLPQRKDRRDSVNPNVIERIATTELEQTDECLEKEARTWLRLPSSRRLHPDAVDESTRSRNANVAGEAVLDFSSSKQDLYLVGDHTARCPEASSGTSSPVRPGTTPASAPSSCVCRWGRRASASDHYPVPYKPWFDLIIDHMTNVFSPQGWPALDISREQGVMWSSFVAQHASTEPALFYARLLFGSGNMLRLRVIPAEVVLWLRAQTIKALNEAIKDQRRNCSDAVILAVGRFALYEYVYGDRNDAMRIHRVARKRMIEMRGGMGQLGFPKLINRLIGFSDIVMAGNGTSERLLQADVEVLSFSSRQCQDAMKSWRLE